MSRRNKVALFVIILLGLGIFGYSLRDVKLGILIHDFAHIHIGWLLVAIGCMLLYFGLEGAVVKIFVDRRMGHYSWKSALRIPLIEQLFNGITPMASGGQPAQLIAMLQSGIDGGRASSILLMKFVVYQAMIVLNFLVALLIGFHYMVAKMSYLSLFVVFGFVIHFGVIVGLLLVMFWPKFTKRAVRIIATPLKFFVSSQWLTENIEKLDVKIDLFYEESVHIVGQWRLMLGVAAVTFLQLMVYYLVPYFIMNALGYTHSNIVMVTCLHILIVMVISIFPIPGGSGGAEYSFTVLFSSFITNNSKLVLAMVLWRLLTYYFGILLGLGALAIKPDKVQHHTKLEKEA
ncbi:flippase-like domain-containing protein [Secundilactobacillus kimchicus]|uniref:Phosphatidylglycerol lysyltransferase n=1 Tax=Secundilactobacillus kimchicus JCM 15530 TaxID=1302272 RepID=A0A0R1HRS7_9LACO|nr:lysylphosphatidylglycerol synthase transmembrane domain-containing protein [Secundilactobacillus kimchicus]KRK47171.1 Lysylphosphatidylglycerol synthetase [Secundilactobacillus kimchicus JCM 15530]MBT9671708.1 flippase-like domain-containing protein [Secundilactobacillus kimchicus]